jgi:hypothetical protein
MRKFRGLALAVPLLMLVPAPANANIGACYVAWADAVTACAGKEPCSSAADAELMACLQREVVVNE